MKKTLTFLLLSLLTGTAKAQSSATGFVGDSIRIIDLQELVVNSIKRTPQQQLLNFVKNNSAATLEDILARLPEISLVRRGSYGMEPTIRYFSGGQINIQVDGMRIHGACTDRMDPVTIYIEPVNLQNLQVQTAGNGFMNGSSIGGTVNMKMAEPSFGHPNKITGVFSSGYQSAAKSFFESVRLNYSAKKWAAAASGTYRNSKDYRSGGGTVIPFSRYEKVNYSLSVKFQQSRNIYLKADMLADDGWNIGYPALPMDVGYAAARIASFSIHGDRAAKRLYTWQTKIYINHIRHFMDDSKRPLVPMHMDMPGVSKTYGVYTEGEMTINRKQKLLIRADGASTFLQASMTMHQAGQPDMYMLTWPDNRRNQYGISASWLWQPDSLWHFRLSARADLISSKLVSVTAKEQVGIFNAAFTGRRDGLKNVSAQVTKKIGRKLTITSALGYSERMPTTSELFGFYLFNNSDAYDYIGDPLLGEERSVQADLSLLYNRKRSRVQVSGYYSRVYGFISGSVDASLSTMTPGARGVKVYSNLPHASVMGVEASGFFKPMPAADIVSTIRYTYGLDDRNKPLPGVAPFKNITSFRFQPGRFFAQLETECVFSQNNINMQYGEDGTPGYVLLHTRFGCYTSLFKNNMEVLAGIENIFDKKYHEHLDWGNISRPGRNIYLQVRMTINN